MSADEPQAITAPDRSLTLKPGRLAGSASCLNCGTELKGPFCYYCGQPDRNFFRFFPALLREFMTDFLELDSRFVRTMKPLLFRPGKLTRDYLEGRRFRYTPPLRLYLFSSIAFFLLAAFMSSNAIDVSFDPDNPARGADVRIGGSDEQDLEKAREVLEQMPPETLEKLPPGAREKLELDLGGLQVEGEAAQAAGPENNDFRISDITFNDKPWDRETNPVDIEWLPAWVNDWINDEVEQSPDKAKRINENPNLIVEQVFDILPATMFVLLPVVALVFKFWYLFAKRYYVEHLIFALHNHSFLFVSLTLILVLTILQGRLAEGGAPLAAEAAKWLLIVTAVWIPLYMLVSLRHMYRQNWFLTLFKFGAIGLSYVTILGLTTSVVALLSFVLL